VPFAWPPPVFVTRAPRAWASLTVKRQGTGHTLTHGQIQVGVGQHNSRVVGIQAQYRFQAMGFGVHLFQRRRTAVGANEREHINLAALHQWADGIAAAAKNNIDHTGGERFLESLQQRANKQHAVFCRLKNHGVTHHQSRNKRGEGFIQRVRAVSFLRY